MCNQYETGAQLHNTWFSNVICKCSVVIEVNHRALLLWEDRPTNYKEIISLSALRLLTNISYLKREQMVNKFADDISSGMFFKENMHNFIQISMKFVPEVAIRKKSALV